MANRSGGRDCGEPVREKIMGFDQNRAREVHFDRMQRALEEGLKISTEPRPPRKRTLRASGLRPGSRSSIRCSRMPSTIGTETFEPATLWPESSPDQIGSRRVEGYSPDGGSVRGVPF